METKLLVSWLYDKAARAHDHSYARMLNMTAKRLRELDEKQRWIAVTEPPKERGCYFVTVKHWLDGKPVTREAYWNGADWLSCDKKHELTPRVTHWMPLPEPPKEAE
jgi:hypothetical protein